MNLMLPTELIQSGCENERKQEKRKERSSPAESSDSAPSLKTPRARTWPIARLIALSDAGSEFRKDLGQRLREAGMPEEEVEKLMGALMEFWQKGGSIDELGQDQAILNRWGLRPDSLLLVKIILDARRLNSTRSSVSTQFNTREFSSRGERQENSRKMHNTQQEEGVHLSAAPPPPINKMTSNIEEEEYYADDFEEEDVDDGQVNLATFTLNTRPVKTIPAPIWGTPPPEPPPPLLTTPPLHRWYSEQVDMSTDLHLSHTQKATCRTPDTTRQTPPRRQWQQSPGRRNEPSPEIKNYARDPPPMLQAHPPNYPETPPQRNQGGSSTRLVRENSSNYEQSNESYEQSNNTTERNRTAKHIINGQWKLGKCIGQGSFGAVYTCMDEATGQLMAVKMMALPMSSEMYPDNYRNQKKNPAHSALRDLCSEIGLMRSFNHPNIVRYLGATVDESSLQLYIFQEWVPGGSIASLSEHYGAFAESVVRRYTCDILRGLEYLHANQIIHRDIKAANVPIDESGVAKLADFGASHRLGKDGTLTNDMKLQTMRGTPYFMAPEVLHQDRFGRRSDVWSVGGVALQMATTHPPWKILNLRNPMALFCHIAKTEDSPPIDSYNLSPMLRSFILRCFIRDPAHRPHAHELLRDPFLTGQVLVETHDILDDTLTRIGRVTTPASTSRLRQNSFASPPRSMASFQQVDHTLIPS